MTTDPVLVLILLLGLVLGAVVTYVLVRRSSTKDAATAEVAPPPAPAPPVEAEPERAPAPVPEPEPEPAPQPDPQPDPAPEPEPEPAPEPEPEPEPEPAPAPAPPVEAEPEPEPDPEPEEPDPEPEGPEPEPEPEEPEPEAVAPLVPWFEVLPQPDVAAAPGFTPPSAPTPVVGSVAARPPADAAVTDPAPPAADPFDGVLRAHVDPVGALPLSAFDVRPSHLEATGAEPTYVPRDVDAALDTALATGGLVRTGDLLVVRGQPGSGCTRTAVEAVRRADPDRPALVLAAPRALPATPAQGAPFTRLVELVTEQDVALPRGAVVVVDRAEEHLGRGLTVGAAQRLLGAAPGCTLVITIDARRLTLPGIVDDATEDWLRAASAGHELGTQLSDVELARASTLLPDLAHRPALRALPAWCAGREPLRERQVDGRQHAPLGTAVVAAVATWRRLVLRSIVPVEAVADLTRAVLTARADGTVSDVTDEDVAAGLRWARTAGEGARPLVEDVPGDPDAVRIASVVVDDVLALEAPPGPGIIDALLPHLADVELLDLARTTAADGSDDVAAAALSEAMTGSGVDVTALAALQLGVLEEGRGNHGAAVAAYRRAATGDHPLAPIGSLHLGGALEQVEQPEQALAAYDAAVASRHPEAAPRAAFNLGWLHQARRDHDAAARAYELAISSEHHDAAPQAAFNLGWLLEQQRRLREAEDTYRQALDSGHPDIAPMAAVSLGILLERMQRGREADVLYRQAAQSGHEEAARAASIRLRGRKGR